MQNAQEVMYVCVNMSELAPPLPEAADSIECA